MRWLTVCVFEALLASATGVVFAEGGSDGANITTPIRVASTEVPKSFAAGTLPADALSPTSERFAVIEGRADAPHLMVIISDAHFLGHDYAVIDEDWLYALTEAGQLRVGRYFFAAGGNASTIGNMALLCAGPEGFRTTRTALASTVGREALENTADGEIDGFKTYIERVYARAGIDPAKVESCVFDRSLMTAFAIDVAGRKRQRGTLYSSYGGGIGGWPYFVIGGALYSNMTVADGIAALKAALAAPTEAPTAADPASGADTHSLPDMHRDEVPANLKGMWTSTPTLCGAYFDQITPGERLDAYYPDIGAIVGTREKMHFITARRIWLFDEGDTDCAFDSVAVDGDETRFDVNCANIVTPQESYPMQLTVTREGAGAVFRWTSDWSAPRETRMIHCMSMTDMSQHFAQAWTFDETFCEARSKLAHYGLVFLRDHDGDLVLRLWPRTSGLLPETRFDAVSFVDGNRLDEGSVRVGSYYATVPLGGFERASDMLARGLFLDIWTAEAADRSLSEYRRSLVEVPLFGSARAMGFLATCTPKQ